MLAIELRLSWCEMNKRPRQCAFALWLLMLTMSAVAIEPEEKAANIDPATGLVVADGFELVTQHCTNCHSTKLITQNKGNKDNWRQMIRWMQSKQGLQPLGAAEAPIIEYLANNYGPLKTSRRGNLPAHLMPPGSGAPPDE